MITFTILEVPCLKYSIAYPQNPIRIIYALYRRFRKLGVPYLGVLIIRTLLFKVAYLDPLFSETPI